MLLSFSDCENQRFGWGWWGAKSCVSLDSRVLICIGGDRLSSIYVGYGVIYYNLTFASLNTIIIEF